MKLNSSRFAIMLFVGLLTMSGCQQQQSTSTTGEGGTTGMTAEVDPHDIPLTEAEIESLKTGLTSYEDALGKIKGYRDAIHDAITAGNPPGAHRSLDELDIVLGHLPTAAREFSIPKSEWETINTSAQRTRELFNQIHSQIDAGETPDFDGVAEEINRQIASLEGVATS
ncbi:MAG: hypothetical protein KDA60_07835 [Planctomycetales bacterium]|nr:hypothetical protein [Planctomycetales bacterium]